MRIITRIAAIQLILAMVALVIMGAVTVADVVLKQFGHPISGAYDLVESLLPVVIFHGLPATLLRRQNIVIDLIDHLAGPRRTRLLVLAADIAAVAMLAMMTWAMLSPARQAFDYGDRKLELGLPLVVVWGAAILGMAGCIGAALVMALRSTPLSSKGR